MNTQLLAPTSTRALSRLSLALSLTLTAAASTACVDEFDAEEDELAEDGYDTDDWQDIERLEDPEHIDVAADDLRFGEDDPLLALTTTELTQLLLNGNYTITSGYNPVAGGHAGIDIGGAGDGVTTVYSPVNGTVIANTTTCGKVAIYDGSNTIILAHMSNLVAPAVGSSISIGASVGKVSKVVGGGCSATGAHLHIEIRTGSNASMAAPANDNTATTRNPLTYGYSAFGPVSLVSPSANASVSSSPMSFVWSSKPGANSYRLQIATTNAFTTENCTYGCAYNAAASSTSRLVTLGVGTYYWRVRAGNSGQGGNWSTVRMVKKI